MLRARSSPAFAKAITICSGRRLSWPRSSAPSTMLSVVAMLISRSLAWPWTICSVAAISAHVLRSNASPLRIFAARRALRISLTTSLAASPFGSDRHRFSSADMPMARSSSGSSSVTGINFCLGSSCKKSLRASKYWLAAKQIHRANRSGPLRTSAKLGCPSSLSPTRMECFRVRCRMVSPLP